MIKNHLRSLSTMSDYEVEKLYRRIESSIRNLKNKMRSDKSEDIRLKLKSEEIELCYAFRELESREGRKKAHKDYLSSLKNK